MVLGESYEIAPWFFIHFTENPGMAWGMEFGGTWGKYVLTIGRIIAIGFIVYWLRSLHQKGRANGVATWGISLVLAGAIGNVLDSLFYGLIFGESIGTVAPFMPDGGGYASFLQGRVVDMLYFPLYSDYLPGWVPFWGGQYFTFFRPIFNFADTAISTGIGLLFVFQRNVFNAD